MDDLVEFSRDYFLGTSDRESRVWVFLQDDPSSFLGSSIQFGGKGFGVFIADSFSGLQPTVLSYQAFTEDIKIGFRPTLILDSNMVTYLHQYVTSGRMLTAHQRMILQEFLRFVISKNFDYNPFFYYIEGTAKDGNNTMLPYAEEISHSILRLHTMSIDTFLDSGNIVTDPRLLALYSEEYGGKSIEEIAPKYARSMIRPTDPHIDGLAKLIYATILKIGLIHKTRKGNLLAKYNELIGFMEGTLNIALGLERMLALRYFAGEFDTFIPIQKGAKFERALKRLRAAAWDLLLLRLPAKLLSLSSIAEVTLGYVCTSDRSLWQLAQVTKIESIMQLGADTQKSLPMLSYDYGQLQLKLGPKAIAKIMEADKTWQINRMPELMNGAGRISYETLEKLIIELERDIACFCEA